MRAQEQRIYRNRIRRRRQLKRRISGALILLCLSFVIGIAGSSFRSSAQDEAPEVSYKYFTSVMVMPGDTLTSLAGAYMDDHYDSIESYIMEVRMTNHMLDEEIRAGEYLILPYFSTEFR